jgi:uncharacterized protein (DUF362 family)
MNQLETVLMERCSYAPSSVANILEKFSPLLELEGNVRGKRVLVKPNLISSWGPPLACTDPRFIIAVVQWLVEHGASVLVGDSPAFGTTAWVLRHLGADLELKRLGAKVIEFSTPKSVTLANGHKISVAAEALDCDLMMNIPKIKAHNQMYMTIGVKNFFGIVKGIRKSLLHMQHGRSHRQFAGIILDLLALLPEHVTIVDGIKVMHVAGPLRGRPLDLNCVAASRNPLALDTALLSALELEPEKSPLWDEARERGYPVVFLSKIQFPFLRPADFHGSGFIAPHSLIPVRFNLLRFFSGHLRRIVLAIRS